MVRVGIILIIVRVHNQGSITWRIRSKTRQNIADHLLVFILTSRNIGPFVTLLSGGPYPHGPIQVNRHRYLDKVTASLLLAEAAMGTVRVMFCAGPHTKVLRKNPTRARKAAASETQLQKHTECIVVGRKGPTSKVTWPLPQRSFLHLHSFAYDRSLLRSRVCAQGIPVASIPKLVRVQMQPKAGTLLL